MIFGVSPTKDAVVIVQATGSGETFVIKSINSIQFQARRAEERFNPRGLHKNWSQGAAGAAAAALKAAGRRIGIR